MKEERLSHEGEALREKLSAASARLNEQLIAIDGVLGVDVEARPAFRSSDSVDFPEKVVISVQFSDWPALGRGEPEVKRVVGGLPFDCWAYDPE